MMRKLTVAIILSILAFQSFASDNDGVGAPVDTGDGAQNILCQLFDLACGISESERPEENQKDNDSNNKSDNDGVG